jgi:hypothetical protein
VLLGRVVPGPMRSCSCWATSSRAQCAPGAAGPYALPDLRQIDHSSACCLVHPCCCCLVRHCCYYYKLLCLTYFLPYSPTHSLSHSITHLLTISRTHCISSSISVRCTVVVEVVVVVVRHQVVHNTLVLAPLMRIMVAPTGSGARAVRSPLQALMPQLATPISSGASAAGSPAPLRARSLLCVFASSSNCSSAPLRGLLLAVPLARVSPSLTASLTSCASGVRLARLVLPAVPPSSLAAFSGRRSDPPPPPPTICLIRLGATSVDTNGRVRRPSHRKRPRVRLLRTPSAS